MIQRANNWKQRLPWPQLHADAKWQTELGNSAGRENWLSCDSSDAIMFNATNSIRADPQYPCAATTGFVDDSWTDTATAQGFGVDWMHLASKGLAHQAYHVNGRTIFSYLAPRSLVSHLSVFGFGFDLCRQPHRVGWRCHRCGAGRRCPCEESNIKYLISSVAHVHALISGRRPFKVKFAKRSQVKSVEPGPPRMPSDIYTRPNSATLFRSFPLTD